MLNEKFYIKFKNSNWLRFIKYLYKYWKLEVAVIASGFVLAPLHLLNPYLSKLIIDKAFAARDLRLFLILLIIGAGVFILISLIQFLNTYLAQRIFYRVNFDMTKDLFNHLQRLPLSFFNDESTGGHVFRINSDVTSVSNFICENLPQIITLLPRFLLTLVIIVHLNWRLALVASLLAPFTCLRAHIYGKWLRETMRGWIEKSQAIYKQLYEVFSHVFLIKALGKEDYEIKRFQKNLSEAMTSEIKQAKLSGISTFTSSVVDKVINGIIALYGGFLVIKGRMTLGSLAAVVIYSAQLVGLIKSFGLIYERNMVSSVSRQRLTEILDKEPQEKDDESAVAYRISEGRIEFREVNFGYNEDSLLLKGMSFSMPPAAKVALVGKSGCGKTTLLNLILRLYQFRKGSILIDGLDVRDIKLESLKAQFGVAFQEPFLLDDTIKNNILYPKEDASMEEVAQAARIAEVHDFIMDLPAKYNTRAGEGACKISEGQKQRIAIARAVINKAKILILDEAMSMLDSYTENKIINNLRREFRHSTVIVVAHRLSTVRQMDLVYFFKDSGSMEIGTHEELLERSSKYNEIFSVQIEPGRVSSV